MNYFEFYCGDYARDTAHLSLAEHGAFLMLLSAYYSTEKPLPADMPALHRIARAMTKAEQAAVNAVAEQFFPVGDDGLRHNDRADAEVGKAQGRIGASRSNGKLGGRPPKQKPKGNPPGFGQVPKQEPSDKAPHTPHATRHEPSGTASLSGDLEGSDTRRERASTAAGEACRAMRQAGLGNSNPGHPELLALLERGATTAQFSHAAAVAAGKGKGFAYALGVLKGQIDDAAKQDPSAPQHRGRAVAAAWIEQGETP